MTWRFFSETCPLPFTMGGGGLFGSRVPCRVFFFRWLLDDGGRSSSSNKCEYLRCDDAKALSNFRCKAEFCFCSCFNICWSLVNFSDTAGSLSAVVGGFNKLRCGFTSTCGALPSSLEIFLTLFSSAIVAFHSNSFVTGLLCLFPNVNLLPRFAVENFDILQGLRK